MRGVGAIDRLSVMDEAKRFRDGRCGRMLMDAVTNARAGAFGTLRRADSTLEQRERANGALDVLDFLLEEGLRIDDVAARGLEAK